MARRRSPAGERRVVRINSRIGYACLVGFVFVTVARALSDASIPAAIAALAVAWAIWLYAIVLMIRKTRID